MHLAFLFQIKILLDLHHSEIAVVPDINLIVINSVQEDEEVRSEVSHGTSGYGLEELDFKTSVDDCYITNVLASLDPTHALKSPKFHSQSSTVRHNSHPVNFRIKYRSNK